MDRVQAPELSCKAGFHRYPQKEFRRDWHQYCVANAAAELKLCPRSSRLCLFPAFLLSDRNEQNTGKDRAHLDEEKLQAVGRKKLDIRGCLSSILHWKNLKSGTRFKS
ncbi:hypothetical protein NDU88_008688 [Pleurodeles waltl]|uniref:Uncharacterized protein n=1 Tax=Pleurodeles waltl TaxID=8319 RepID=A0AAV7QP98_PLEWA|nr:hypothetical protein NDU88_008688 [Pleurodeles waltl]